MKPSIVYKIKGFRREKDLLGDYQLKVDQWNYYDKDKAQRKFIEMCESNLYYKTEYIRVDRKQANFTK